MLRLGWTQEDMSAEGCRREHAQHLLDWLDALPNLVVVLPAAWPEAISLALYLSLADVVARAVPAIRWRPVYRSMTRRDDTVQVRFSREPRPVRTYTRDAILALQWCEAAVKGPPVVGHCPVCHELYRLQEGGGATHQCPPPSPQQQHTKRTRRRRNNRYHYRHYAATAVAAAETIAVNSE